MYIRILFALLVGGREPVGLDIGGFEDQPNWPKMGPSLLIATCLILAIRTAKWPSHFDEKLSASDLDREIDYAAHLEGSVLRVLVSRHPCNFPSVRTPWYQPSDEDVPK